MRSISVRCVSSILNPALFIALNIVSICHRCLYASTAFSGLLKETTILSISLRQIPGLRAGSQCCRFRTAECNVWGSRWKMNLATSSGEMECFSKKRCILRRQESALAGESKNADNLLKHTVFALHRAIINSAMSLIWARLMFFLKKLLKMSVN